MQNTFFTKVRPRGESLVWFTATGLVTGLLMILFLLGLVVYEGVSVFWPKRVEAVQISNTDGSVETLLGAIIMDREKQMDAGTAHGQKQSEYQFFVGNKDAYGQMFRFVDADKIISMSKPENVLRMKRVEYGDALAYPVKIILADKTEVSADDKFFDGVFRQLIDESNMRREQYMHIEKDRIGAINTRMEQNTLALRTLEREHGADYAGLSETKELTVENTGLQAEFETLAEEAKRLREKQNETVLCYRLADGSERTIAIGNIMHAYYPNRISVFGRLGESFANIWEFLSEDPREANTEGGIFPAIFGTFVMTVLMSALVMPFGVLAAIYLREYAKQGPFVNAVRIAINNLAGVPSIVYGVFGVGFFVYLVGGSIDRLLYSDRLPTPTFGTGGILWAAFTLALMTVPVVVVATEEALASVPRGVREASLACGASKWQTIQRIVLPASAPGILTGLILAMARGAGEVAPLMLVGVVKYAPMLPLDGTFPYIHLERKFMHLGFHIYDLGFQSPDSEAAKPMVFATTLLLILLVVTLNIGAIMIRNHLRKKYASSVF